MSPLVSTTELIVLPPLPVLLPKPSFFRFSVVFAFVSAPGAALSSAAPVSATHWGAAPGEAEATSVAETPGHRKETLGRQRFGERWLARAPLAEAPAAGEISKFPGGAGMRFPGGAGTLKARPLVTS